ncbi:MAG: hypothetical protein AB4050_19385 [Synechococcus sp.]
MKYRQNAIRIGIWLVAEVLLNFYGLDNLADYSEYVFERGYGGMSVQALQIVVEAVS